MSYQSEVLAVSPVAYWRLGETSGTTAQDETANNLDGTYVSVTLGTDGLVVDDANKAITTNGTTSRVDCANPALLQITGEITVSAIVTISAVPTGSQYFTIAGKGYDGSSEGWVLRFVETGGTPKLSFSSFATGTGYDVEYDISGWALPSTRHIAATYDGTARHLYVNGELVASLNTAFGAIATTSPVYIGAEDLSGTPGRFFPGVIDEVFVCDTELSAVTIAALAETAGYTPGAAVDVASATVANTGAHISVTLSEAVAEAVLVGSFVVRVNGNRIAPVSVSGSLTSFTLKLGARWILAGQTVTVGGGTQETPATATNSSEITAGRVAYVGRKFGAFLCYTIITYTGTEVGTGTENPNDFAPTDLDIDQWLDGVEAAGMAYAVLTAKAHDGFCMWDTATTTQGINSSDWFAGPDGVDIVGEFCAKCRARGIAPIIYMSVWDKWFELNHPGFTDADYIAYTQSQLSELLTKYGEVSAMWFDGWGWAIPGPPGFDLNYTKIPYATISNYIKAIQPSCLVLDNNHELDGAPSEILEREVNSDGNPAADNEWPSEQCHSPRTGENWYWKPGSITIESPETILAQRDLLNSRRCSYLVNFPINQVGQMDDSDMYVLSQLGVNELKPTMNPIGASGGEFSITINAHAS